ncbi:MAG: VCBS repeat-containing protein [Candidatus Hydrogenedentes bacterium]|nr:VCBS repeat-containing protein [Candidatus Hydrogenedentota bacterium]
MIQVTLALATAFVGFAEEGASLRFERERIGDVIYEACSAFDVNNDGAIDIVSGEYWFEGPDFQAAHKICTIRREVDYYDDFSDYPMDVNGDGYTDIITGAWWGESLSWRENPKGQPVEWTTHVIAKTGNIERPCFYDIDKDGEVEVIPNTKGVSIFKLIRDADGKGTGEFKETKILEEGAGHGIGFGDLNGDGNEDIVLSWGWLEAPDNPYEGEWTEHRDFAFAQASCPIIVIDVNKDGMNDIIVGQGHNYGLHWWEQSKDADGKQTWTQHDIEPNRSQFHDMQLADIDNDGEPELVTGKRYRAHNGADPGSGDPLGVYYYEINGGNFVRNTVDYGPAGQASGTGIYLWVEDINGNGWKDIIAPGKEGLYLFRNLGPA